MTRFLIILAALVLSSVSAFAANPPAFDLYLAGKYDEAISAGVAMNNAPGFTIACRAVMAQAMMKDKPCPKCLKRAEKLARDAIAADPKLSDAHVLLAVSLGYEARIVGPVFAKLNDYPEEAKSELDLALKSNPNNAWALGASGGWNIEIVRTGGERLGYWLYGASVQDGLDEFARAFRVASDNVVVRYQYALSLGGYDRAKYRKEIADALAHCVKGKAYSAYDRYTQSQARELEAALDKNDTGAFNRIVKRDQGYP
ncbi:MAG: hypothetical protein HY243_00600 [Proteobacteria bacterium]|nr:hypothetical protein [Pseudomonadota bacterium]